MAVFTKEEVRELFAENNKLIAENSKAIAENNKGIAELKESQKKTDAQIAKTNKAIDRLGERIDERIDRIAARQEKGDAQLAKTDAQLTKLGVKMDKMNEMYGGLGNNVGQASEELFFNMLNDNPVLKQIRFDPPQRNWHNVVGKLEDEYDIVMKNDYSSIFILEVKFKATKSDVEKLLTTKQENFNILFPEYKDYDQHWGLAATIIDEDLRKMALENGLTVLQYKGKLIQHNPPSAPKGSWKRQLIGA